MSGMAEILFKKGYRVSGSDILASTVTHRLSRLGIPIHYSHQAKNISGADAVIYSSAILPDNVELLAAKKEQVRIFRRAEMLGELMRLYYSIGIAGTHGKTTTTTMIGQILTEAGLNPTLIVGGIVKELGSGARFGDGNYLVVEADEFDRSFLAMFPTLAVITTLEAEHLDCYQNLEEIKKAFIAYANKIPFDGRAVVCIDEPSIRDILPAIRGPKMTYGLKSNAEVYPQQIEWIGLGSRFYVFHKQRRLGIVTLQVPGIHNIQNALASVAVGLELKIPFPRIRKALEKFRGVHRRFEIKGERKGVLFVDDYAHHPTEIQATLASARLSTARRIVAIFQPHLFSRTRDFYRDFGCAFFDADVVAITSIYPSREKPIAGVSARWIVKEAQRVRHPQVLFFPDPKQLLRRMPSFLRRNDLCVTLGAGDIWKTGEALMEKI